jgi:Zn-dependent protease with chaperone function
VTPRALLAALAIFAAGCSTVPAGAYYPGLTSPTVVAVSQALYRAARAAGDDPTRYSFAFVKSDQAVATCGDDATLYLSDALVRLPLEVIEPVIAHEVAHEILGHVATRRRVSLSVSAGFGALGIAFPGAGFTDFFVNPLIVQALTRRHELSADRRALEILRAMGYRAPRRALARALEALDQANGAPAPPSPVSAQPSLRARLEALGPLEPPDGAADTVAGPVR